MNEHVIEISDGNFDKFVLQWSLPGKPVGLHKHLSAALN
jgi:hypothetical protein